MVNAFLITFREGLEAFLIVGITLAFLRRTGVTSLLAAARAGIALSVPASAAAAYLFARAGNQALWDGVVTLIAAVCVLTLTVHLWQAMRDARGDLDRQFRSAVLRGGLGGWSAVALFITLMIAREGMSLGVLLAALIFQMDAADLVAGAIAGLLATMIIAWSWSRFLPRLRATRFLQCATIFLALFECQLLIGGLNDLDASRLWPATAAVRWLTAPFAGDGAYGPYLSYLLVAAPLAWLVLALFLGHGKAADGRVAHVGR